MMTKRSNPTQQKVEVGGILLKCSCCGSPVVSGTYKQASVTPLAVVCESCLKQKNITKKSKTIKRKTV